MQLFRLKKYIISKVLKSIYVLYLYGYYYWYLRGVYISYKIIKEGYILLGYSDRERLDQ